VSWECTPLRSESFGRRFTRTEPMKSDAQRETCKRYAGVFREMVAREGYAE